MSGVITPFIYFMMGETGGRIDSVVRIVVKLTLKSSNAKFWRSQPEYARIGVSMTSPQMMTVKLSRGVSCTVSCTLCSKKSTYIPKQPLSVGMSRTFWG